MRAPLGAKTSTDGESPVASPGSQIAMRMSSPASASISKVSVSPMNEMVPVTLRPDCTWAGQPGPSGYWL